MVARSAPTKSGVKEAMSYQIRVPSSSKGSPLKCIANIFLLLSSSRYPTTILGFSVFFPSFKEKRFYENSLRVKMIIS